MIKLPAQAAAKLSRLELLADTARQSAIFAVNRSSDIRRVLGLNPDSPDAEAMQIELKELTEAKETHNKRHRDVAALVSGIHQWMRSLQTRPHAELELAPVKVKPRAGETIRQAIARTRDEIIANKQHQRVVSLAPLPRADIKRKAAEYVAGLAAGLATQVGVFQGAVRVSVSLGNAIGGMRPDHILAMMAWLDADKLVERLEAEIDATPEPALALPEAEKVKRLQELVANLDQLERLDEALVVEAHVQGNEAVIRRPDANPMAVLGVRFVKKEVPKAEPPMKRERSLKASEASERMQ